MAAAESSGNSVAVGTSVESAPLAHAQLAALPPESLDGGAVQKRLVSPAPEGAAAPASGQLVGIHYRGTLLGAEENGVRASTTQFDGNNWADAPFQFELGAGQVIRGFETAVKSMRVGERAVFDIRADFAYGKSGAGASIPPDTDLRFDMRLSNVQDKPRSPGEMTYAERFAAATAAKDKGNDLFRRGETLAAVAEWQVVVEMLAEDPNAAFMHEESITADLARSNKSRGGRPLSEKDKPLVVSARLNLAAAYIKLARWHEARVQAEAVLNIDGMGNAKALFRNAVALTHLQEFDAAKKCFLQALEISPNDPEIKRQLDIVSWAKGNKVIDGCGNCTIIPALIWL